VHVIIFIYKLVYFPIGTKIEILSFCVITIIPIIKPYDLLTTAIIMSCQEI